MAIDRFSLSLSLSLCAAMLCALPAAGVRAQPAAAAAPAPPTVAEQVEVAYNFGDFDELERLYAIYGKPGVRSPATGTSRLTQFWMGTGKIDDSQLRVTEGYYVQLDALTRKWAIDHPKSVLAQLLYVDSLVTHGWSIRGSGYANTVSSASWEGLGKYLNLALEHLRSVEALAAQDSSWNKKLLFIGDALGWSRERLLAAYENGVAKNPDDDDLHRVMMENLLPKWGGDYDLVDRFIMSVTQKTREKRGWQLYAELYADVSYSEAKQSLFRSTRASWPKMKAGFDDLLSRYPHPDHRNRYAYFACMANDREALQEQLRLMGGSFERIFWGGSPEKTFEECKAMAQQL